MDQLAFFVTGGTGVIGSALVPALLRDSEPAFGSTGGAKVFLLIRARDEKQLGERLSSLIEFWGTDLGLTNEEKTKRLNRLDVLRGDVDLDNLGLNESDYERVTRSCTHIFHCAGVVRMNLPLDEARLHAVGSARNILALALSCKRNGQLKKIEFISTVGVGGQTTSLLQEDWKAFETSYHNTYEQAKSEAEDIVQEFHKVHHLPITVHRPSMVVGDSKDGKSISYQVFYHIVDFLSGRWTLGLIPFLGDRQVDTIPVDIVVDCLIESSRDLSRIGKVTHMTAGSDAISLRNLREMVHEISGSKGQYHSIEIPAVIFRFIFLKLIPLFSNGVRRKAGSIDLFLKYLGDMEYFQNPNTRDWWNKKTRREWPRPMVYLPIVLRRYVLFKSALEKSEGQS